MVTLTALWLPILMSAVLYALLTGGTFAWLWPS